MQLTEIDSRGSGLIQIVDGAMAEAARRSGPWLVCKLGCTQCCVGPFPITQLDSRRLLRGLAELQTRDSERAERVLERARDYVARVSPDFPGDPASGLLDEGEEAQQRFAVFADDESCPALDPETGGCDLYAARPMTCRTFGPPMRSDDGLVVCELCYEGASEAEIESCEVNPDPDGVEATLLDELEKANGKTGETIVAYCLALAAQDFQDLSPSSRSPSSLSSARS
jgi:Fe-S-cluster containining protein